MLIAEYVEQVGSPMGRLPGFYGRQAASLQLRKGQRALDELMTVHGHYLQSGGSVIICIPSRNKSFTLPFREGRTKYWWQNIFASCIPFTLTPPTLRKALSLANKVMVLLDYLVSIGQNAIDNDMADL
jgi:hypothetical protein